MENFEKWLVESDDRFGVDQKELAKWFKDTIEHKFNVHVSDFSMDIDDFLPAVGMKIYRLLMKYNLIKIIDQGPKRWVKANISPRKKEDEDMSSEEAQCKQCGQPGKANDPKCWVCGAAGKNRFGS